MMQDAGASTSFVRYPDACPERRASRLRPCVSDPDPCGLRSGFAGDEYCLKPPPPELGIQLHFGPSSYYDEAAVQAYLVLPGQELTSYAVLNVPKSASRSFAYAKISMRPGSHHLINMLVGGDLEPGFVAPSADCGGRLVASFPSTTAPVMEWPPQGVPAPENEGVAWDMPANASLCLNYHRYNDTQQPALTEAWINIWFAQTQAQRAFDIVVNAGPFVSIAAHSVERLTATSVVSGEGRILTLFGHRHAAAARMGVYLNDALVYLSNDWTEPRRYELDSWTLNPAPDLLAGQDGAQSGELAVTSGDRLTVDCQVTNRTNSPLSFGRDLYAQEMCLLFLSAVGVGINPVADAVR